MRLTESQLKECLLWLEIRSPKTVTIARKYFVEGLSQRDIAADVGVTKGRVSQVVSLFNRAYRDSKSLPLGYERVEAILPGHKAYLVKQWAKVKGV